MDSFEQNFINDIKREDTNTLIEMFKDGLSFYSSEEIEIIKNELISREINTADITVFENDDSNLFDGLSLSNDKDAIDDEDDYGVVTLLSYLDDEIIYEIDGVRGRKLYVFENKCIINTRVTIGSLLTQNATDGEKVIYYSDVVGVQFKPSRLTIGFLQLETPGLAMNNVTSNFFNENSFTFDKSVVTNEKMAEIACYIIKQIDNLKKCRQ